MQIDPAAPWEHPLAETLDATTLETWIALVFTNAVPAMVILDLGLPGISDCQAVAALSQIGVAPHGVACYVDEGEHVGLD